MDREMSISDADKDAALTLLSAKNVVVGKKKKKKKNAGPDALRGEIAGDADGTSSDGSLAAGRGAGKRVPKPPRWRAYEMTEGPQSLRRPGRATKKEKNVEWIEKHLAKISIGKKPGEPLESDTIMNNGQPSMSQETVCYQEVVDGYDVVDVNAYSQQSLYEMALMTETSNSIPPVLEKSAGVKKGKVSAFTGLEAHRKREQEEKKMQKAAKKANSVRPQIEEMSLEEKERLVEKIVRSWKSENHRVWALVGKYNVPTVNRREINYLRLFLVVRNHGGYDKSVEEKSWSNIARQFHMEESNIGKNGSSLRLLYKQFILPIADLLDKHAPAAALASVKEAEAHAEATGHSNFEESVEKLTVRKCVECGKVCRTTVEEESHTRFTQHATFEDQTCDGVDTEKEMSVLRREQQEEDTDMMEEPEVNQEWVEQLVTMGFSKNKAIRSLYFSDNAGVEGALEWISSHEDDPRNSDEPLLVPAKKEQPKLTPEEAKAKADELLRKAKAKREAEEREMEKLREAERIRSGKELAAMARKEEEQRLKRMADERKREKEEALRAKEKIKKKLEQDRMERRAAMGLPPELTEEEKEEERRRLEQRAKEESKSKLPIKSREKADAMRNLLVAMKKAHEDSRVGFETLNKLVGNVVAQPDNPKFRTIKLENPAIQKRVGKFPEAIEFLQVAGFRLQDSVLTMDEGDTCLPTLQSALESLDSALNNPFFGAL